MNSFQAQVDSINYRLRLIIFALLVSNFSACGFRLAGSARLPPQLASIQLISEELDVTQITILKRRLKRAGADLKDSPVEDAVRLNVAIKVLPERKLADTAGSGKTIIRLFRQLDYGLSNSKGDPLLDQSTILRQIDVERDSDDIAGLEYEKQSAGESLDEDLIEQLIFQLKHFQK